MDLETLGRGSGMKPPVYLMIVPETSPEGDDLGENKEIWTMSV